MLSGGIEIINKKIKGYFNSVKKCFWSFVDFASPITVQVKKESIKVGSKIKVTTKKIYKISYTRLGLNVLAIVFISVVFLILYRQYQAIVFKETSSNYSVHNPIKRPMKHRPKYHGMNEKVFTIKGFVIPVYVDHKKSKGALIDTRGDVEQVSRLKKIVIDFSLVSSNLYIKSYFADNNNLHLIMDRLYTRIRPIEIDFPLELEGKIIITEKIKDEVNILIKDLNIDGEIEDVYVHRMVGA